MRDSTEAVRREMIATGQPQADLEDSKSAGEKTWDTQQLQEDFEVLGFMAPFVAVRRRSDGKLGSLEFTTRRDQAPHRVYFGWREDT